LTPAVPLFSLEIDSYQLQEVEEKIRKSCDTQSSSLQSLLLVPQNLSNSEENPKRTELQNLLKEKLYLQDRRFKKYGLQNHKPRDIPSSVLKTLLRDCDLSSWRQMEGEPIPDLKIDLLSNGILTKSALLKWQINTEQSKGMLHIPGLLSVSSKNDFKLLQRAERDYLKKKKTYFKKDDFVGESFKVNPWLIPRLSKKFETINFGDASFEVELRTNKSKTKKYKSDRRQNSENSKSKKSEHQLIRTARMSNFGRKRVKVARNECFVTFDKIERKISDSRQKSLMKISSFKEDELNTYKKERLKKVWSVVCSSVVKIQKFFQKDSELNAKKLGILCAKERRKMLAKTKKNVKDYVLRAKRLNKEVIVYWKRRGKELNDLKKKREKIKLELKKKEDEKKEQRKQKKKIEYLIKQSDIYAHIMAEKLGIKDKKKKPVQNQNSLLTKEDVDNAQESINCIIKQNKERVNNLEQEMSNAHKENHLINGDQEKVNFDFSKIELDEKSSLISTPSSFQGKLKEYQLKGLRWLNNLFEQGINGILADEMGLGKTVQAIALMTHIAEKKNCWGPFLVIAPTITLFNWQNECSKFSPKLKILPYWGSKKDREILRKSFRQKYFGKLESSSHIVITSYSFAVRDFKYLDRLKWQYIILDEAQAIKNIRSQRWSTLLSLKSRNKLLLTGTPIQNTMAELWALLHFIMPQLFDSHEEFQEWFSKDIEAHSKNKQGYLNKTQLNRLHAILKPFMLRRVKKDVEKEIGKKIVTELICEMSARQKLLYNNIKKRICLSDLMQMYENKQKTQNLMNLVMQFRKVVLTIFG
jgi:SNF2 family DNA or RNA helicase